MSLLSEVAIIDVGEQITLLEIQATSREEACLAREDFILLKSIG